MDGNSTSEANEICDVILTGPRIFLAESAEDCGDDLARGNATPAAALGADPHARLWKNPSAE